MSGNSLDGLVTIMFGVARGSSARRSGYQEVHRADHASGDERTYDVEVSEQLPLGTRNVSAVQVSAEVPRRIGNATASASAGRGIKEDEVEEESEEDRASVFVADDSEALREMREYKAFEPIRELQKKFRDYLSKKDRGDGRYEHESDISSHAKSSASVAKEDDGEEEHQDPESGQEESKYIDDLLAEVARRRGSSLTDRLPSAVARGDDGHVAESDDGSVLYSNRRARTVSFGNEDDANYQELFPSYMAGEDKEDGSGE